MALVKCPECGHQVSDHAKTCPSCGIEIAGKIVRCPDCGEVIFKEQNSCPNCHCTINAAAVPEPESTVTAVPEPVQPEQTVTTKAEPETVRPRKRNRSWIALLVAFVIALIVVFLGIYFYQNTLKENEMRAYENAIMSGEPAVLQNFLDMYTDAPAVHRDSVSAHLEALKKIDSDWTNAALSGSKAQIENYMKMHPQSIHCVEAKIMIDSLDWMAALAADNSEAYSTYLRDHEDGAHYDEAHARFQQLEALKVTADDKRMVSQLFTNFYGALARGDEALLTSTLAPVLTSFLHREQASKSDVILYMNKIHEENIIQMTFTPNNDWSIKKQPLDNDSYKYLVDFTVDQRVNRTDESKERFCTYKVQATISPDCKIEELNMKKIVQ